MKDLPHLFLTFDIFMISFFNYFFGIMKEWASIQKFADNDEVTPCDEPNKYEHKPTEHQRQYRWPIPDNIHVVTYQKNTIN